MDILGEEFHEGMISALRGVQDIPCAENTQEEEGIEQPTIPDWLKERLKIKVLVEVPEEDDMADFLARLETVAAKKLAKVFSTIQKDEIGRCTMQIAVLIVDKSKEDITPQEYAITTVDLGPTTKGQEVEDLDNSVASIKARLEKEVAKKREYKEIECLKEYIQHLIKPLDQADPVVPPLLNSSQETIKFFEEEMVTAKETKEWITSMSGEAATFVERLMLAYGQTSPLLSRIVVLVEAWGSLEDIQDKIIPCLKVLKGVPKQELIDGKVIAVGAAYDFNNWYWALIAWSEVLEKVKVDGVRVKEQTREILNKVLLVVVDVLEADIV